MSKVTSQRLVIDASVALAAGNTANLKQACQPHQDFLEAVKTICHCVVLTPELLEEWNNHAARFARTWLQQMFGRRKVVFLSVTVVPGLDKRAIQATSNDRERAAIEKDLRLVYAALHTDKRIASLDEEVRALLRVASRHAVELREIMWINPKNQSENPLGWLKAGAPDENHRKLAPPRT